MTKTEIHNFNSIPHFLASSKIEYEQFNQEALKDPLCSLHYCTHNFQKTGKFIILTLQHISGNLIN